MGVEGKTIIHPQEYLTGKAIVGGEQAENAEAKAGDQEEEKKEE